MTEENSESVYTNEQRNLLLKGIVSFQNGDYFEAHDLIEEAWQELRGNPKIFWQAVIQLSVSFYHFSSGNRSGATGLARKANLKINSLPAFFNPEIKSDFLNLTSEWSNLSHIAEMPEFPPEIVTELKRLLTPDLLNEK
ncbi:MAG: DUF309 domain-containing protein [Bacteroidetes bacterium]|nr:DUF309 domain-containing protein [Bacteroidota bacterium]